VEELILLSNSGVLGNIKEDFSVLTVSSFTEVSNSELGGISLFLELSAGHLIRGRTNLLENPVNNVILSSATSVLSLLAFLEEEESGEALNAESLGNLLLLSSVNLGEVIGRIILGESLGGLGVLGGQLLAVTTPGSVELNQKVVVFHKFFIKVCVSEDEDSLINFGGICAIGKRGGESSQY